MDKVINNSIVWGSVGSISLLLFYFLVLVSLNSFSHVFEQLRFFGGWIAILAIGFGWQIGLYVYIKHQFAIAKYATAGVTVAGGVSATSMVACCAHHLIDIAPLLGLSAIFLFAEKYQLFFIIFGILSNVIGIIYMMSLLKKYNLYKKGGFLEKIFNLRMRKIGEWLLIFVAILFLIIILNWPKSGRNNSDRTVTKNQKFSEEAANIGLPLKTAEAGGLSISAESPDFSFDKPVQFKIGLDTHQGDLNFNLSKKAALFDDIGNRYEPIKWEGGQNGHHLSGILFFSSVSREAKQLELKIFDVYGVAERQFVWNLK